ncbi:hypothetical protein D043_1303B, partial [Vibrio parahaemolyticus EKP-021]
SIAAERVASQSSTVKE